MYLAIYVLLLAAYIAALYRLARRGRLAEATDSPLVAAPGLVGEARP
jgi:cbb3-type cytochrome oxidase subunit 3